MSSIPVSPLWYASGLRWIARALEGVADRMERTFSSHTPASCQDLHFDSDIYLAEIRNRVFKHYY